MEILQDELVFSTKQVRYSKDEVPEIGSIVEGSHGLQAMVVQVTLHRDTHDCNRDHCKRCENPDRKHWSFELEYSKYAVNKRKQENAALIANVLENASMVKDIPSTRKITNAFKKEHGKSPEHKDMFIYDGIGFIREEYETRWGTSGNWVRVTNFDYTYQDKWYKI